MKKSNLRATAALRALALLGAGVPVAFIAAAPAAAQDYTRGTLVGTVTDEAGTPIAGAQVTVRSNEQGYQTTTVTDANGRFQATALATGTYTVIVRKADQVLVEDRAVNVIAGQTNTYGYTSGPQIAGAGANQNQDTGGTIVVTGRRIQVDDFASTQTGANIDVAEIASTVPTGRDQTSLILLAPGTTSGDAGFGNLASISGATVAENAYFVNGLNITDFRNFLGASLIPFEFYRTLDVKTGGYQAEYGRALGGVTSAVTKSGSNELQGGAVVSYSPDWLREQSPNTYAANNEDDELDQRRRQLLSVGPGDQGPRVPLRSVQPALVREFRQQHLGPEPPAHDVGLAVLGPQGRRGHLPGPPGRRHAVQRRADPADQLHHL